MGRGKKWSEEDILSLKKSWGSISIPSIAKNLDRTTTAIKLKAKRLNLERSTKCGEFVTLNEFFQVLGYKNSYSKMLDKLKKYNLPIKKKVFFNKRIRIIYIKDFWEWADQNKQHINFAKLEKFSLGEEPEWADEKRKNDSKNPSKINPCRKWTKEEDALLIAKLKLYKYTYHDLALEFNRTETAIKRRIYDLKIRYRPIYRDNHIKWTDDEKKKLLELHDKGYDTFIIAQELKKSHLSICDKIKKLTAAT